MKEFLMFDYMIPEIPEDSKVLIGLGDSFTHGIGSWSKEDYDNFNGFIDPLNMDQKMELKAYEYSWVNQLSNGYLKDHIAINFGKMGQGNRSSVKEIYLNPKVNLRNAEDGVLVFMLSGLERFDFVAREFYKNCHFYTMWPHPDNESATNKRLWDIYATDIWSEKFVVVETILNIKEAEMFCKANGYKFVLASAFDQNVTKNYFSRVLDKEHIDLINSIPWKNFLYPRGCISFLELLLELEGKRNLINGGYIDYYSKLKYPSRYITNCYHPTREGYSIIAEEIFNFIQVMGNKLYV